MQEMTSMMIQYKLKCFCYKYHKPSFFEATQKLNHLNSDIIKFNSKEFQALFYFLSVFNVYLNEEKPNMFPGELALFFPEIPGVTCYHLCSLDDQ